MEQNTKHRITFNRFDILGVVAGDQPDQDFAEFREDLGTLHDERWKSLTWRRPDKDHRRVSKRCNASINNTKRNLSRAGGL